MRVHRGSVVSAEGFVSSDVYEAMAAQLSQMRHVVGSARKMTKEESLQMVLATLDDALQQRPAALRAKLTKTLSDLYTELKADSSRLVPDACIRT